MKDFVYPYQDMNEDDMMTFNAFCLELQEMILFWNKNKDTLDDKGIQLRKEIDERLNLLEEFRAVLEKKNKYKPHLN
jgi:hypothetical protein